ncbi:MAG: heavy-metal-associated domain-containing protein [Fimbriimonadaceae bacterium]|nr:MAG: heavy-metal-associated domain-containing protein [Fimbriimonadaceae bacterium]
MDNSETKTTINVKGMTCGHCAQAVEEAALSVDGVSQATVDLGKGQATISGSGFDLDTVIQAISEAGYAASVGE